MVSFLWRSWKRSAINASRISAQKRNAGNCGDEDLPIDDGVNHDVTAKPLGIFFAFFKL